MRSQTSSIKRPARQKSQRNNSHEGRACGRAGTGSQKALSDSYQPEEIKEKGRKKTSRAISDQDKGREARASMTTHGLTSSGRCSSPGNSANWILTTATCGARPRR